MTDDVVQQLRRSRLVPVIELEDPTAAPALGAALVAGGLPCAEVTFRTAGAADAIRRLRDAHPAVLVGAGTVLNAAQVDAAVDAGAAFLVAPGLNPATVARAQERGVPMLPGVCTPSEIERILAGPLPSFTDRTITDPERLRAELAATRERGYAAALGEIEEGLNAVAAPVRDGLGAVVAAVSISGPAYRVTSDRIDELGALTVDAAVNISTRLGFFG